MKKLVTYLLVFSIVCCLKSFGQPPEDVKPLSKGVYSKEGRKEFRQEKKDRKHVFKLWKKVFRNKKTAVSMASLRSNPHFNKEIKAEHYSKKMMHNREKKAFRKTERNIQTKAISKHVSVPGRKKHHRHHGEK